jgi:hypothetical protein
VRELSPLMMRKRIYARRLDDDILEPKTHNESKQEADGKEGTPQTFVFPKL